MPSFVYFLCTLAVALAGGLLAKKLKLPAGPMVGSMVFVVIFNLLTDSAVFYSQIKVGLQIFSGAMIGSTMSMAEIKSMKTLGKPTAILLIGMVFLNLTFGMAIYALSGLDAPTSLFAAAPGGVSDMALIASDLGADTGYVAILQVFRLLIVLLIFPPLFKKFSKDPKNLPQEPLSDSVSAPKPVFEPVRFLLLLFI
ncbi:MAG: AbrB family transcriptional regulator, partial [Clostridia bacterium]|nr:AbrB family transcriptional regulator [Clostridia bacterium]